MLYKVAKHERKKRVSNSENTRLYPNIFFHYFTKAKLLLLYSVREQDFCKSMFPLRKGT